MKNYISGAALVKSSKTNKEFTVLSYNSEQFGNSVGLKSNAPVFMPSSVFEKAKDCIGSEFRFITEQTFSGQFRPVDIEVI